MVPEKGGVSVIVPWSHGRNGHGRNGIVAEVARHEDFYRQFTISVVEMPEDKRIVPLDNPAEWEVESEVEVGKDTTIYLAYISSPGQYRTIEACLEHVAYTHRGVRFAPDACAYTLRRMCLALPPRERPLPEADVRTFYLFPGTRYRCLQRSVYIPAIVNPWIYSRPISLERAPEGRAHYLVAFVDDK